MIASAGAAVAYSSGFTLVEMVVALTILGLISVALVGGMRFGTAVWRSSAQQVSAGEQVRGAQEFLRRTLAAAYPILEHSSNDPTSPAVLAFEGERARLRAATMPAKAMGLQTLSLSADTDEHGLALVAELTSRGAPGDGRRETVMANLRGVEFAFLTPAASGQPAKWEPTWTGRSRLPELIRIRLTFPDGDTRRWPDLFVAPRLRGDVSCRIDFLSGECQGR
jgi:general secretion pathway protein J